jgi:hypothetical protein
MVPEGRGAGRLRITTSPLRVVMSRESPTAPAIMHHEEDDDVLLDLYDSPNGGWWEAGVRVADSDEEALEYVRGRLRRFRQELDTRG